MGGTDGPKAKHSAYLAIDVGGTKTLLAVFSKGGEVLQEVKFPTKPSYSQFLKQLKSELKKAEDEFDIEACCCAIPGTIDQQYGIGRDFGNLKWEDVHVKRDIAEIFERVPIFVQNDAKLAALYEALLFKNEYKRVLYLTVSTGIGAGIIINGMIDHTLINAEPGQMVMEHKGKVMKWEDFASGRALVVRFGKRASELEDAEAWKEFSHDLALGIDPLVAVIHPDAIIIGGGVGTHLEKFKDYLKEELNQMENAMVKIPPILKARRAEEAVIYGCYEYIKQNV
jgi:predicted NBD/HSP70 family sugar kinase